MDAALKEEWAQALESGKYKQGHRVLRRRCYLTGEDDEFCCLGVLVDYLEPEGWVAPFDGLGAVSHVTPSDNIDTLETNYDGIAYPTERFLESVGLSSVEVDQLAHLNDSGEKDFVGIAKYIREEL